MKEKMRSNRRIFTRMPFEFEICPVFRMNNLLALTLNRLCHFLLRLTATEDNRGEALPRL